MQVLGAIVDGEPEFEFVLNFQGVVFLEIGRFLVVEGSSIESRGLDLGREVFLVREVVLEDPGVEVTKASPRLSGN